MEFPTSLKAKFPMFIAPASVINNVANLQPRRPFRAIPHVSPQWLPPFSLFYVRALDCRRKIKVLGSFYNLGTKICQTMAPAEMEGPLLDFINTLLQISGGSVGKNDGRIMAALFITL